MEIVLYLLRVKQNKLTKQNENHLNTKIVNLQSPIPRKSHRMLEQVQCELKKPLKELEYNLNSEVNFNEYAKCKNYLELIYDKIVSRVRVLKLEANINGICQWYDGEKSTKFFLNFEKKDLLKRCH